jgi:hypothetical protein
VTGAALMEGVVGNPPFLGGKRISTAHGPDYASWLAVAHDGTSKNTDLSAHFFRRAATLLGEHGALGLIATNTIAQGDTRTGGLLQMSTQGWIVFEATTDLPWPGAAAVTVSIVHLAKGAPARAQRERWLDGRLVEHINSLLRAHAERDEPRILFANSTSSFNGVFVRGDGFVLSLAEGERLRREHPIEARRILPYIGGEEVNSSPTSAFDRYVVDVSDLEERALGDYPVLKALIEVRVKPYRMSLGETSDDRVHKMFWWRFARSRPALYAAIAPLDRCLVTSRVAKHLVFSFQPTSRIFSEATNVFPLSSFTAVAVLQSRVHEPWARLLSSSMKMDLRYSASDCFETFPFPNSNPRAVLPDLESIGQTLYDTRAAFMVDTNQGLTKTYNALKDPACDDPRILALRELHEEMDRAVLAAYGWSDVAVPPYCPKSDADRAALQAFEDEVIDRLYFLNAERAREEERLGIGAKGKRATAEDEGEKAAPKPARKKSQKKAGAGEPESGAPQGKLF